MVAYDYDKQEWVEGGAAKELQRNQVWQEIQLLEGLNGEEYLRFTGRHCGVAAALRQAYAKLDELLD